MSENLLMKYSENLAVKVEKLCKTLPRGSHSNIIFQIRKSSSSVFANITEAQYPQSLADPTKTGYTFRLGQRNPCYNALSLL